MVLPVAPAQIAHSDIMAEWSHPANTEWRISADGAAYINFVVGSIIKESDFYGKSASVALPDVLAFPGKVSIFNGMYASYDQGQTFDPLDGGLMPTGMTSAVSGLYVPNTNSPTGYTVFGAFNNLTSVSGRKGQHLYWSNTTGGSDWTFIAEPEPANDNDVNLWNRGHAVNGMPVAAWASSSQRNSGRTPNVGYIRSNAAGTAFTTNVIRPFESFNSTYNNTQPSIVDFVNRGGGQGYTYVVRQNTATSNIMTTGNAGGTWQDRKNWGGASEAVGNIAYAQGAVNRYAVGSSQLIYGSNGTSTWADATSSGAYGTNTLVPSIAPERRQMRGLHQTIDKTQFIGLGNDGNSGLKKFVSSDGANWTITDIEAQRLATSPPWGASTLCKFYVDHDNGNYFLYYSGAAGNSSARTTNFTTYTSLGTPGFGFAGKGIERYQ